MFPDFPSEIRHKIWQAALCRERLIDITLRRPTPGPRPSWEISPQFNVLVDGHRALSKLFRVSHESREVARAFFRVQIPCRFKLGKTLDKSMEAGTLYVNPDWDILHVQAESPLNQTLFDFLYRLRTTYDHRGIGATRLALNSRDVSGLNVESHLITNPSLYPDPAAALALQRETVLHLRDVFFLVRAYNGRNFLDPSEEPPAVHTNHSFPISAASPSFERIGRDPRPIADDLRKVCMGSSDPRYLAHGWLRFLDRLKVSASRIDYRFLLTCLPVNSALGGRDRIYDHDAAETYLRVETEEFHSADVGEKLAWPELHFWMPGMRRAQNGGGEAGESVKPAVGYWLLPIDALGPLQEEGVEPRIGITHRDPPIWDLTEHWPELALTELP